MEYINQADVLLSDQNISVQDVLYNNKVIDIKKRERLMSASLTST